MVIIKHDFSQNRDTKLIENDGKILILLGGYDGGVYGEIPCMDIKSGKAKFKELTK